VSFELTVCMSTMSLARNDWLVQNFWARNDLGFEFRHAITYMPLQDDSSITK